MQHWSGEKETSSASLLSLTTARNGYDEDVWGVGGEKSPWHVEAMIWADKLREN